MNAFLKQEFTALENAQTMACAASTIHALHPHELLDIILHRRFAVEYQPVVNTLSGATVGYEALSRFFLANGKATGPDGVFEQLHDNPLLLFHTELEMKRLQILHAPDTELLFLNLDPDSFHAGNAPGFNVFTELFRSHRRPGREIMIEVIENLHIRDVVRARSMIADFKNADIKVATDDLGVSNGLVSFGSFCDSTFIKFDRSWLANRDKRKFAVLEWFHGMALAAGARTVLEGVETHNDLALARDIGFDCVQGFLFRDRFITEPWQEQVQR